MKKSVHYSTLALCSALLISLAQVTKADNCRQSSGSEGVV